MANINDRIQESSNFQAFAKGKEGVTVDQFLANMSPAEKADFLKSMNSDENEVFLDKMSDEVLKDMGKTSEDNLSADESKEFADRLNGAREAQLLLLPPQTLVEARDSLLGAIATENDPEKKALYESQYKAIDDRMDQIVKDYVSGEMKVDQGNVADVYDGFKMLLETRDPKDPNVVTAKANLDKEIDNYDELNGLKGLTPKDAEALNKKAEGLEDYFSDENFDLDEESFKMLTGMQFESDEARQTFVDTIKSEALNSATLSKEEMNADKIKALSSEIAKEKMAAVITADLLAKGDDPKKVDGALYGLRQGSPYSVSKDGSIAYTASHVNGSMGLLNRLATKVGRGAPVVKTLYNPIKKIDTLAEKRWGKDYVAVRDFMKVQAKNMTRAAIFATVCKAAAYAPGGAQIAAVGLAGMSVMRFAKMYKQQKAAAKEAGQAYGGLDFIKNNWKDIALTAGSTAATFAGLEALKDGVRVLNAVRTGSQTYATSRALGESGGVTAFKTLFSAAASVSAAEIAGKTADFVTDSVGLDGMLGHETTEMVKTPGDETTTHGYSDKAMEIAEARNNGEGRFSADGSHRVDTEYSKEQLGTALDALKTAGAENPELSGNEQMLMYKMYQAHLLGSADAPVSGGAAGETLGDRLGVVNEDGSRTTFQDTYGKLIAGEELSKSDLDVIRKVEMNISGNAEGRMGQLITDVGLDGKFSYNTNADPGFVENKVQGPEKDELKTTTTPFEKGDVVSFLPFDDQWLAKKKESLNERAGALGDWVKGSLLKDMYKKDDKMTTAEQRKAKSAYVVQDASSSYKDGKAGDNKIPSQKGVIQINEMGSNDSKIKGLLPEGKSGVARVNQKMIDGVKIKGLLPAPKEEMKERALIAAGKTEVDAPVVAQAKPNLWSKAKGLFGKAVAGVQKDYRQQQEARDKVNRFVKIKVKSFIKKALQTARDTYSAGKSTEFVSETAYQLPPEVSQKLADIRNKSAAKKTDNVATKEAPKEKSFNDMTPEEKTSKLLSTNLISGVHDAKKDSSR